jgi:dienelactone hydrolase
MLRHIAIALSIAVSGHAFAQVGKLSTPAEPQSSITIEDFGGIPFFESPALSPNGQFVAARVAINGKQTLSILPLFDKTIKPKSFAIEDDNTSLDSWQWVNDDWLVANVSRTVPVEGNKWRIARAIGVGRLQGEIVPLGWKRAGQNASDVLWVARDGTPRILLGMQTSIYSGESGFWDEVNEVDVSTGKSKVVVNPTAPIASYYADGSGFVRMGVGHDPETQRSKLVYRSPGQKAFSVIDRANRKLDEKLVVPAMFLADTGKAVTYSDDENGFTSLFELELPGLAKGKQIFGTKGYDVGRIVHSPNGNSIVGVSTIEGRPRMHWLDSGLLETQALLDKAVGAGRASIVDWDRSQQKLLVKVGGTDQAGSFYYYDRSAGGKMAQIAMVDSKLKMRRFGPVSTLRYTARDGMEIPAVLTLPKGKEAKNLPLILLPHGGPQARDYETWDWINQALAFRGYAVIQPNFRGSTGLGTKHLEAGEGQWGLKMQDDLNDAVDHLASKGIVDPKRVCVLGASYGGYAAMRAAQRDGSRYRCAISYAGVSDMARMARYDSRFLYGAEYKRVLIKQAPDFDSVSPLRFPEQFSTPILIMHGKLDLRVPVNQSREMADRLKAAGKPYRYVEQPLGDHHFSRAEDRIQFLREVDAFLKQHNPPD